MAFRFRKSITLFPGFKLNVGKKSVGFSVGGKYGGYSYNSRSGARARVSAPGTGLSYVASSGGKSSGGKGPKKPFYKRWYFWLLVLMIIGSCTSTGDKTTKAASSTHVPRPTFTAVSAATPVPSAASAASATPAPSPTPRVDDYILNTNTRKFHETYCSKADSIKSGNRSEFTGTREELIQRGYEPCSICNP